MQTRRGFLKKGLLGGALLAVGGAGYLGTRGTRRVPLPPEGLETFDEVEYAVVHALAARFIPAREGFPSIDQVRVAWNADRVLARAEPDVRKEVKQLLKLFENGLANFLFGGRTSTFTSLPPEEQDRVLLEWRDSRLAIRRAGYLALRGLVLASYYGSPLTWAAVNYPGPPPGFHDPNAPLWKGAGAPRPAGNGVFAEVGSEAAQQEPQ